MFRAIFELFLTLLAAYVGRAIIGSLMKGFGTAAAGGFQQQAQQPKEKETPRAGELHKDPVCGTYVSESSNFRRQLSGKTVYYCSDACRQKHAA
jgi:YHS domain-containing protein